MNTPSTYNIKLYFSYYQKDKSVLGEWYRSKATARQVVKYCDMDADCDSTDPPGCDKLKQKILSNGRSSLVDKLREYDYKRKSYRQQIDRFVQ